MGDSDTRQDDGLDEAPESAGFRIIECPRVDRAFWLPRWRAVVMPAGLDTPAQDALLMSLGLGASPAAL